MFVHLKNKHGLNEPPVKLSTTKDGKTFHVQTSYFDFDLNRHVTSTRYIDWMMDTFDVDFHKNNLSRKLSVNFMKETLPGDSIILTRSSENDTVFSFEGVNQVNKTVAFRGKIDF